MAYRQPSQIPMQKKQSIDDNRLRAYAQLLMAAIGLCSAIYLIVTGEKPPSAQQVLKDYS